MYINNKPATALTFWKWEEKDILMPSFREKMAEVTASEIVKLLNDKNVGFKGEKPRKLELKDIAILVRKGTEAKIIRQALNRRNLKSVYLSEQDSIYDTDEAPDVLIWLKAMANPRDEGKVRAAVSTGTLGFSKEYLHSLTLNDVQWDTHLNRFQKYQTCWQKSGILPALRLLIHEGAIKSVGEFHNSYAATELLQYSCQSSLALTTRSLNIDSTLSVIHHAPGNLSRF